MMQELIGRLNPEDLGRWRLCRVKIRSLELNPTAYSQRETEEILVGAHTAQAAQGVLHVLRAIGAPPSDRNYSHVGQMPPAPGLHRR